MTMDFKEFGVLPREAAEIRREVFVEEQGFREEFDEADQRAAHLVLFISGQAAATCRYLEKEEGGFLVGRIAVRKPFRKRGLGAELLKEAERRIAAKGGKRLLVHAQTQALGFYEKQGFSPFGEEDEEEGGPHVWMKKEIGTK